MKSLRRWRMRSSSSLRKEVWLLSFSAEELEDAAKHGERVRDGYFVAESKPWKEVDGKFYYLEDIEGEIMGSEIDPYFEIKVQPDGSLMYCMDMLLLERV